MWKKRSKSHRYNQLGVRYEAPFHLHVACWWFWLALVTEKVWPNPPAFTHSTCVSVCFQDPWSCAMLPCYRCWVHCAGQGELHSALLCPLNHLDVSESDYITLLFTLTELPWAWKNGLRRMYFGKTLHGFPVFSQHCAHAVLLSWSYNNSWLWCICLGED